MKTIYLLRHAKSSWDDPTVADHDRPLAPRGRKALARVAAHLAAQRPRPTLVLCSSAIRARDTCAGIVGALGDRVEVQVEGGLYGANRAELLGRLRELPEPLDCVLLIGHNPAVADLAVSLAGEGHAQVIARMRDNFPTGAVASLSFGQDWVELGDAGCYLDHFVVPRQLAEPARRRPHR